MSEKIVEVDGKRYMKVQKGKYFDKKKNRKMRRHHPVRWILISAFCLLVVAPVGFVFGAFYDPSTKQVNDDIASFTNSMMDSFATGLVNMPSKSGVLEIEFKNDFIDSLLSKATEMLQSNPTVSKFVKKIYVNIDGDTYDFIVDLQASFFKTRVHLTTKLYSEDRYDKEEGKDVPYYVFKINNIVLGRLPLGNLAKSILPNFIKESDINNVLHSEPLKLSANLSLNNMEITYKKSLMKKELGDLLERIDLDVLGSDLSAFILNLYSSVNSYATFKDKITIGIDFSDLGKLSGTINYSIFDKDEYKKAEADFASEIETLINDGSLKDPSKGGLLFQYFMYGYNYNTDIASLFKKKDETGKEVDDTIFIEKIEDYLKLEHSSQLYKTYAGNTTYTTNKMDNDAFAKKIKVDVTSIPTIADLEKGLPICEISDEDLSKFLRNSIPMGYTFGLPLKTNDGKYNFSYICLDDFFVNMEYDTTKTDNLKLYANINLNGVVSLPLRLNCEIINPSFPSGTETAKTKIITFKPITVELGKLTIPERAADLLLDYIGSSFSTGSSSSPIGFDNNMFTLNTKKLNDVGGTTEPGPTINNLIHGNTVSIGGKSISDENLTIGFNAKEKGKISIVATYKA